MKKTRIFSMVFAIGLLGLVATGCSPSSGGDSPDVKKETHTAKSADLIKFKLNVTNAKYLATQWADETDETKARAAFARKASREGEDADTEEASPLDTLVAVVENADGELVEETVLEVPAEELKLADWCVPQPVREIYQCPYTTTAEKAAKGIYTVFACYIDWWKYTDDTPAPGISMLMYQKPDGTTVDVLNKDGRVNYYLTTWQKENEGEDYIQFDQNGNLFALAHDDETKDYGIFRYHPDTDKVDVYKLSNIKGETYIRNFKITPDGKWIFLNVMVDDKQNNVYAVQVNTTNAPISMYEYKTTETNAETSWAVSSIGINPKSGFVYWYVDDYNDWGRPNAGLYVAEADIHGNFAAKDVKHYHAAEWWQILDFVKTHIYKVDTKDTKAYREDQTYHNVIPATANTDYSELLSYLKGLCAFKGDIELNFSAFAGMEDTECAYDDETGTHTYTTSDFKKLAEGDLKDEAALKYLFETSYADALEIENPSDWEKQNLFSNLVERFVYDCWNRGLAADEGFVKTSEANGYTFPLHYFMYQKGTTKSAYLPEGDEKFFKSAFGSKMNGIILANNEGTWVLSDIWDENKVNADGTKGNNSHSTAFQLTDNKGNFTCNQPGDLATLQFRPRWDYDFQQRDETDPWYQNPVVANTTGIAALSKDKKTIYYQSNGTTKDLLATDANKALFFGIYSFKLEEKELIYNAVKTNGGYITVSIDLATGTAKKLPLEKKVESMLGL